MSERSSLTPAFPWHLLADQATVQLTVMSKTAKEQGLVLQCNALLHEKEFHGR